MRFAFAANHKFQDIPFTYSFSLFSGIYFVVFKRRNNNLQKEQQNFRKIIRFIFLSKEFARRNGGKESCLIVEFDGQVD